MDKWDPNWNKTKYADRDNYWAGAKKACDELGMSLPDTSKFYSLTKKTKAEKEQLGLLTNVSYWTSSEDGNHSARIWIFFPPMFGGSDYGGDKEQNHSVLCVGD